MMKMFFKLLARHDQDFLMMADGERLHAAGFYLLFQNEEKLLKKIYNCSAAYFKIRSVVRRRKSVMAVKFIWGI